MTGCLTSRNLGDFRRILKGPAVFNVWDQTKVLDISMWDIATKLASDWQVAKLVVSIYFWTPKLRKCFNFAVAIILMIVPVMFCFGIPIFARGRLISSRILHHGFTPPWAVKLITERWLWGSFLAMSLPSGARRSSLQHRDFGGKHTGTLGDWTKVQVASWGL